MESFGLNLNEKRRRDEKKKREEKREEGMTEGGRGNKKEGGIRDDKTISPIPKTSFFMIHEI